MRIIPLVLVLAAALGSGCARSDWIERTLVTVDVTGVWLGSMGTANQSVEVRFELGQQGSKVKGDFRVVGGAYSHAVAGARSGPIDGTLAGDVFRFTQTNGVLVGETTVSGDEMTGYASAGSRFPLSLRRINSPSRPNS